MEKSSKQLREERQLSDCLAKQAKINAKIKELDTTFKDLDKNKLKIVKSLIDKAAFADVSLRELEEIINIHGYTDSYQNGESQFGVKSSEYLKAYIALSKNYASIIKTLVDIVPQAPKAKSKLDKLKEI